MKQMHEQNMGPVIDPRMNDWLEGMAARGATGTLPPARSTEAEATASPEVVATASPTAGPTVSPTAGPTASPTAGPTAGPTASPTAGPTVSPTAGPTVSPTAGPTVSPKAEETAGPTAEPTASPEGQQRTMPSPTPALGAEGLESEKTEQPKGEETPAGLGVEFSLTPRPTAEETQSPLPTPAVTQAPVETGGDSDGVWGWLGIIALLGAIVFLAARLILRRAPSLAAKHGVQRGSKTGSDRMPEHGKRRAKPSFKKQAGYSPTVAMGAGVKRGKDMQNGNHASAAQPSPYRVGYAQTIGKRPNQEDSYGASTSAAQILEKGLLAVVADGIGGMEDGQVASGAVVRTMFSGYAEQSRKMAPADRLLRLAASAQSSVLNINRGASARCGSTVVSILADGDQLSFLSIGDSRIYLYRGGALLQLNREHKFGSGHDENVALGYTDENIDARRRGAITSYIGRENLTQIDRNTQPLKLMHGDRILLMTDGVFGTLSAEELVACQDTPPQSSAERMIAAVEAKNMPHQDNATVVIVEYS